MKIQSHGLLYKVVNGLKSVLNNQRGSASIFLAITLVVILGSAGLVLDMGVVYAERVKLSNAMDAAILAGAQELPGDPVEAEAKVYEYLALNDVTADQVILTLSTDNKEMTLTGQESVPHYFLKVLGLDQTVVHANSKVILGPVLSAKGGIRPFAVEDFPYSYGELITLKEGGGDGYHGNYGAVSLGGTGTCILKDNALYGYEGTLKIGDVIYTEPGNMATIVNVLKPVLNSSFDSFENHERDSFRLWTIPLVDTMSVDGRTSVTVVGFAEVFVEGMSKHGGQVDIEARFVRFVLNGEIDLTLEDHGTYGIKLVN